MTPWSCSIGTCNTMKNCVSTKAVGTNEILHCCSWGQNEEEVGMREMGQS